MNDEFVERLGKHQQLIEKLMRGFISLEKRLSDNDSRSEAMEKETYDLMAKMVQRINDHKASVDTLKATVTSMQQELQKLTILVNDLALKAKDAESKPKRVPRKKVEVVEPVTEPVAPVPPIPAQPITTSPSNSSPQWDGVEFPIVRSGVEITPAIIARCRMLLINNKPRANDIPEDVWNFVLAQTVETQTEILKRYGYEDTAEDTTPNTEGVDQVLTAINTGV